MPKTASVEVNILDTASKAYGEMVASLESPPQVIVDQVSDQDMRIGATVDQFASARLLHAAMGCVTESGELLDQMKKHLVYGKPLDETNFKEELGDILWYIQLACNVLGTSFSQLMLQNAAKLKVRFGDRFDFDKVLNRDLDAERAVLEAHNG